MIVGIDLGTTHSLVAVWRDGATELVAHALGHTLTPSVVGLDDQGRVLVGQAARERLHTHPQLTTALFKRYMGSATEGPPDVGAVIERLGIERLFGGHEVRGTQSETGLGDADRNQVVFAAVDCAHDTGGGCGLDVNVVQTNTSPGNYL